MRKNESPGMSLIECIIAVFLVTVAFSALVSVYPTVYKKATMEKNRFVAAALAEGILESVKSLPYGTPYPPALVADRPFTQIVEGQQQPVVFKVREINGSKIQFDPSGATGKEPSESSLSCIVSVTIEWEEGTGASSAGMIKSITRTCSYQR
jgi:type II secretory pathway pseudopilin PulG